jgi:predicted lipoprotein
MKKGKMKKTLAVILMSGFLTVGLLAVPALYAQNAPAPATQQKMQCCPEIHKAIRQLRQAKQDLEKAAHDYCGHRVAAIQAIDQALHELEEALKCREK